VNEVLSYFGNSKERARRAYVKYINEGAGLEENYEGGGLIRSAGGLEELLKRGKGDKEMFDERILGNGTFVEEILRKTEKAEKKKMHDLNKIIDIVSRHYEKGRKEILNSRLKGVRESRDLIVYLGVIYLGKSLRELGEALGIKRAAASASMYRARERIEEKGLTEDILNKLDNVP
jgi:tRNA-dihydrouridine synthase